MWIGYRESQLYRNSEPYAYYKLYKGSQTLGYFVGIDLSIQYNLKRCTSFINALALPTPN